MGMLEGLREGGFLFFETFLTICLSLIKDANLLMPVSILSLSLVSWNPSHE